MNRLSPLLLALTIALGFCQAAHPSPQTAGSLPATAARPAGPEGVYIVPQSHLDVAWDWRFDPETIEVCIPMTFGRALDNLERFPDFFFSMSQVPLYEGMRQHHPELAARVEKQIRDGRWEVVGGHWVEFEGTGPCGEALVRQCVYAKRYYQQTYGLDIRNAWQADAWSHPASLPQILKKCEIDTYVFQRGFRGEYIFWWEAADGSRVLAVKPFFEGDYFNDLQAAIRFHREIQKRYGVDISMWRYGKGDHGGGMNPEQIAELKRQMAQSPVPVRFSRADTCLKRLLELDKHDWPVLRDELDFELEGCHANTGRLKAANRRCENLLLEAETFSALASRLVGSAYPKAELKSAWLDVLMNQFHDVIGGAVVPAGYEDAMELYARAEQIAQAARRKAFTALGGQINTRGDGIPVVVFNSQAWVRTGPVEAAIHFDQKPKAIVFAADDAQTAVGQILSVTNAKAGWEVKCVFVAKDVPSLGYKCYWAKAADRLGADQRGAVDQLQPWHLENAAFSLQFDSQTGDLIRLYDKRRAVEVLPNGTHANSITLIEDTGSTEGDMNWSDRRWSPDPVESWNGWKVIESGPVRTTVRVRNKLPHWSAVDRFVTLYGDAAVPWVQCRTHFEWNEVNRMVKLAFPTPYKTAKPTCDIPYGTIIREASGEERPALQWVDLSDEAGGVSLLNDCRYGHDVREGVIRLDALRSTIKHAVHTEAGNQEVTYALYPHAGDWRQARVMHRGYEFNHPLIAFPAATHAGRLPAASSFVQVNRSNVILAVIKQAEDGADLVGRAYEINGEPCSVRVNLAGLNIKKAVLSNMLEKPMQELKVQAAGKEASVSVPFGASEIVTLRLQ
jgi:alpha-mannosidase